MVTEDLHNLLDADIERRSKALNNVRHRIIQSMLPDGTSTFAHCDGSVESRASRRLKRTIRATETIQLDGIAGIAVTVGICSARESKWRYQMSPLPIRISQKRRERVEGKIPTIGERKRKSSQFPSRRTWNGDRVEVEKY